ncbi:MAG: hypothetical protein V1798_03750 [Pseudomonadota bacterium]
MKKMLIYLLVTAITCSGCYKRIEIPKEQLTNRASFQSEVKTSDSSSKTVTYVVSEKSKYNSTELKSFRVENNKLIGEAKGVSGVDVRTIPLDNVQRVESKEFSAGRTAIVVLGSLVGVALLSLGVFCAMLADSNWGGS